jgi:hypothetical protein
MLGYWLVAVSVLMITAAVVALVLDIRRFNKQQSFRMHDSGHLLTMPVLGGKNTVYHAFMSHSQQDGGDQVAQIKKELEKYTTGTIRIFTDVAAGFAERALTKKTDLYGAIDASVVFLVFLTRTYFTRKWCVIEFRDAIAKGKKIVLALDRDTRHGGMQGGIKEFVEYSCTQASRTQEDEKTGASNLWNQAKASGDSTLKSLGMWVAKHVTHERPDTIASKRSPTPRRRMARQLSAKWRSSRTP